MKKKFFLKIILLNILFFLLNISLSKPVFSETLVLNNGATINSSKKLFPYLPDGRHAVDFPECDPSFSPIGLILVSFPDGTMSRGTGFLIADHIVATAAHVIYSDEHGGSANQIIFVPSAGSGGNSPFGRAYATDVSVPNGYIVGVEPLRYDYAAFQIDQPLGVDAIANHFDLRRANAGNLLESNIRIAGYPSSAQGSHTELMWQASGPSWLNATQDYRINYQVTTSEGQSGSPIVLMDDPRYVVGIHTHGPVQGSDINSGIFFTQEVLDYLTTIFSD